MIKKIIGLVVAVAAVGATVLVATTPTMKVGFAGNASTWEAAKAQAKTENKLFFVDFDASYCATCRNMEQSTYMDNNLANFMRQNVVAARVDVQDFDGVMLSQQYEVEALPTMLIFDSKGKLVHRLVGFQSASNLLKLMQQVQTSAPTPIPTPEPERPKVVQPLAKDEPLPNNNSNPSPNNSPKVSPSLFGMPQPKTVPTSPLDLFEIVVTRAQRSGYSVQVGAFNSYETALDQADMMRELYAQKTILCVDKNGTETVYKLFVGIFESRAEATKFHGILRKNKMDGLVRDLNSI
jgi:thiol-disulfide isomerase/thioredoxin